MRKLTALMAVAIVATACGGNADQAVTPDAYPAPARALALPEPVVAVPAAVVKMRDPVAARMRGRVEKLPGVAVAAEVAVDDVAVTTPGGKARVKVAAIEPLRYRSLSPAVTRDAEFVWSALMAGDVVATFDAARSLSLEDEPAVRIPGWGRVDVGAFADNSVPNIADLLVDARLARKLGVRRPDALVVGVAPGVDPAALVRRLKTVVPHARIRRLAAPAPGITTAPNPAGAVQGGVIGRMSYEVLPNGFIKPDPAWVAANITTATVPIIGAVTCHRVMIPQLASALAEIERAGLAPLIDVSDYGGCYVPRFIGRDPRRALSMHAFGLAVDFNVSQNWEGTRGKMDPRIVEVFERWGFTWGGRWSPPDPMHFELARVMAPSGR